MSKPIYDILLIEDHRLVLDGIKSLLKKHPLFFIKKQFSNGQIASSQLPYTDYDLLISDISIPGKNGLVLCRESKKLYPNRKVVLISGYNNPTLNAEIKNSKTDAFISKEYGLENFIASLNKVMNGERVFLFEENESPQKNTKIKLTGSHKAMNSFDRYINLTTQKEKTVLQLFAKGKSEFEIGNELNISKETVHTHKKRLYKKLDIKNMQGLMHVCWECGLMD